LHSLQYEFTAFGALKGPDIIAQGIALGLLISRNSEPRRGEILSVNYEMAGKINLEFYEYLNLMTLPVGVILFACIL